jgi:hypothetical protein
MKTYTRSILKYSLTFLLGTILGGVIIALATRAIPKMISNIISETMGGMMQKMKGFMQASGCECSPEMCQKMMSGTKN